MPHRTAADIMARSVVTLSPDMDIYGAVQLLLKKEISGAPVVDPEGRLVGVLSEKDCLKVLAGGALDGLPEGKVSDYMTRSVESVTPTTSLYDIVHVLPAGSLWALACHRSDRTRRGADQPAGYARGHRVHPGQLLSVRHRGQVPSQRRHGSGFRHAPRQGTIAWR